MSGKYESILEIGHSEGAARSLSCPMLLRQKISGEGGPCGLPVGVAAFLMSCSAAKNAIARLQRESLENLRPLINASAYLAADILCQPHAGRPLGSPAYSSLGDVIFLGSGLGLGMGGPARSGVICWQACSNITYWFVLVDVASRCALVPVFLGYVLLANVVQARAR